MHLAGGERLFKTDRDLNTKAIEYHRVDASQVNIVIAEDFGYPLEEPGSALYRFEL